MEDFASAVTHSKAQEDLTDALNRSRPFRGFKDVLNNYSDIEKQWYEFRGSKMKKIAIEWLEENNIDTSGYKESNK